MCVDAAVVVVVCVCARVCLRVILYVYVDKNVCMCLHGCHCVYLYVCVYMRVHSRVSVRMRGCVYIHTDANQYQEITLLSHQSKPQPDFLSFEPEHLKPILLQASVLEEMRHVKSRISRECELIGFLADSPEQESYCSV